MDYMGIVIKMEEEVEYMGIVIKMEEEVEYAPHKYNGPTCFVLHKNDAVLLGSLLSGRI